MKQALARSSAPPDVAPMLHSSDIIIKHATRASVEVSLRVFVPRNSEYLPRRRARARELRIRATQDGVPTSVTKGRSTFEIRYPIETAISEEQSGDRRTPIKSSMEIARLDLPDTRLRDRVFRCLVLERSAGIDAHACYRFTQPPQGWIFVLWMSTRGIPTRASRGVRPSRRSFRAAPRAKVTEASVTRATMIVARNESSIPIIRAKRI